MGFENIRSFLAEVLVVVKKVKKEEMTREEETIFFSHSRSVGEVLFFCSAAPP